METINEKYAELLNENARLRRQVEAIKQAAIFQMTYNEDDEDKPCAICGICKHNCDNVLECFSNSMGNWQPPNA